MTYKNKRIIKPILVLIPKEFKIDKVEMGTILTGIFI